MKIYRTSKGILIEKENAHFLIESDWDTFLNDDDVYTKAEDWTKQLSPIGNGQKILDNDLLKPVVSQEIWASGVTYFRSREARMEESKDAGGGDFYERVYDAERPELFFKSTAHRAVGTGEAVRIRKDSKWNVPEPELTLVQSSSGKIIGYTIGNDMSSRDIEGENPLYLPQAKTYDKSAAVGPGILLTEGPLPATTLISIEIIRNEESVFAGSTSLGQMKRSLPELAEYLHLELTFPQGSFLMTGTGVVPPDDFTLVTGDVINITIEGIGVLSNWVE